MTGDFYYCPEGEEVIREDETFEADGQRKCVHCAEWDRDQIVTLIPDDEVDPSIFNYMEVSA